MDQPDRNQPDVETRQADGDEELVALCLDQFLAQLAAGDQNIEASVLERAAPPHVRARISRAKECVAALESVATELLSDGSTAGKPRARAAEPPKKRIARFHVESELGSGGFGIVYLAWDPRIDRQVALKIPRIEVLASVELEQRFAQEARATARLDHPNIVSVLEAGSDGMLPYIASLYYPGVTLAAWLRDHREAIEPVVVARVVRQLALALAHAHAHGVLHRDIKPSNILLAPLDERTTTDFALPSAIPRLMDFGLAKLVSDSQDMTKTGALLGTLRYMPPEQATGRTKDIGPASDVYGLGAVLYELLSGQPPFVGASDVEVLRRIATEEPSRIRPLRPTTPLDLETIALKCLEKEPARRYASAELLADDLDRFLRDIPISARPNSTLDRLTKWRRRNPQLTAFLCLSVFALIGFMAFLLRTNAVLSKSLQDTAAARTRAEEQATLAIQREELAREYAYGSDIRLAQEAWDRSTPLEAKELLERHLPRAGQKDLRGVEWNYLWNSMHHYSQVVAEQSSPVWSLAADAKRGLFATGDREGVVRLWSLDPPKLIRELRGHAPGDINCVVFTPDGETLITGADDCTIRFWRLADGQCLHTFNEHKVWIGALAISTWGTWLVSGDADGRVLMWDLDHDKFMGEQYRQDGPVRRILFRPTTPTRMDSWFISASENSDIRVWDYLKKSPPDEAPDGKLEAPPGTFFRDAAFSATGNALYAPSHDKLLTWDFRPGHDCRKLSDTLETPGMFSVAVDDNDELLFAGGDDGHPDIQVRLRRDTNEILRVMHGHSDIVRNFASLHDSNTFLSGSEDGTVRKWQLRMADTNAQKRYLGAAADALAWSADGNALFAGLHSGEVLAFNERFDQEPRSLGRQDLAVRGLVATADGAALLTVDETGQVMRWDRREGLPSKAFQIAPNCERLKLAASDRLLAYSSEVSLVACDALTGQERWRFEHPQHILALETLGEDIVTACHDGVVRCFDASTGKILRQTLPQRGPVRTFAFSRDGQSMVTGSADKTIHIYNVQTFEERLRFSHAEDIRRVFFISGDERLLVCEATVFSIVNPTTGQTMLKIPNDRHVEGIAEANPNGTLLAVPQRNDLIFLSLGFE